MVAQQRGQELKGTGYELFVGSLSVLSLLNLILLYTVNSESLRRVLVVMDVVLSAIFLGDFLFRLKTAPRKAEYFFKQFGWADLLASLPFEQSKVLRIFRIVRVIRLMRQSGWASIKRTLAEDRAENALLTLVLLGLLVLEFGSLWILHIEEFAHGGNITTAADALWYVIVTISTVGYGDHYPVTVAGRILGTGIIIVGVGIFGTFTGYLANAFLAPRKTDAEPPSGESIAGSTDQSAKLTELKGLLIVQLNAINELEAMLER